MKIIITEQQYKKLINEVNRSSDYTEENPVYNYKSIAVRPDQEDPKIFRAYFNGNDYQKTDYKLPFFSQNVIFKGPNGDFTFNKKDIRISSTNSPFVSSVNMTFTDENYKRLYELIDKTTNNIYKTTTNIVLNPNELKKMDSGFPKFMLNTLYDVYPNNIGKNSYIDGDGICNSDNGLIDIPNTNVPGQTWSILNYFDTNPMVIKKLIEWFMDGVFNNKTPEIVSNEKFKEWIKNNATSLFKDGKYLEELVSINLKSYISGTKTEETTINNLTGKILNNIKIKKINQYCSGSSSDRKQGKDIKIIFESGEPKYAQIKPLASYKVNVIKTHPDKKTIEYVINTYQMKNYKSNPIEYIIFTNAKDMLIFENKNYTIQENKNFVIFTNTKPVDLK